MFNLILHDRGKNARRFRFFNDKFLQKYAFVLNQLDLNSNLFTNNQAKFEVAKVGKSFPILRFDEVTFQNLSIFWLIFN